MKRIENAKLKSDVAHLVILCDFQVDSKSAFNGLSLVSHVGARLRACMIPTESLPRVE